MTSQPPAPYGTGPLPPGQLPAVQPAPPYYYAPARPTNTMAILALVSGLLFAPAGIVLGHIARKQIRQTGEEGDGLALAGLILGYIGTGLMTLGCVIYGPAITAFIGMVSTSAA